MASASVQPSPNPPPQPPPSGPAFNPPNLWMILKWSSLGLGGLLVLIAVIIESLHAPALAAMGCFFAIGGASCRPRNTGASRFVRAGRVSGGSEPEGSG